MRAVINGITIEGTPQEIAEYQQIQNQKQPSKISKETEPNMDELQKLIGGQATVQAIKRCPNAGYQCFCTGACMGQNEILYTQKYIQSVWNDKSDHNHG